MTPRSLRCIRWTAHQNRLSIAPGYYFCYCYYCYYYFYYYYFYYYYYCYYYYCYYYCFY